MALASIRLLRQGIEASVGGVVVDLLGGSAFDNDPSNAFASITVKRNGTIALTGIADQDWISPKSATVGDDYDVRVVYSLGDTWTGSTAWQNITSDIVWSLSQVGLGTKSGTYTMEIRDTATQTLQDSASYTISVDVT